MGNPKAGAMPARGLLPQRLCLAAVLLAAAVLSFFRVTDPDVFWHIKTGQVILETRHLLHTNFFSSTFPDYPWHNMEWLFQVLVALAFNGFGWGGVAALKIGLVLATAAILTRTLLRRAPQPLAAATVMLCLLALMRFRLTERPHLLSFLLFAIAIRLVERRAEQGRALWVLPPLFALWSNIHPELILTLAYLAATLAGDALDAFRARALSAKTLRRDLLLLGACATATLLNPEGWQVILSPFVGALDIDPAVRIQEFRRSTLADDPLFWIMLGATALLFLLRRRSRSWAAVLPLGVLGALGALYTRNTTAFAMAAAPVLHEGLTALAGADLTPLRRWSLRALCGAAALAALAWAWSFDRGLSYRWGSGPDENLFPAAAANFILANNLPPNLYNHYNVGGYLLFRLHPRYGVYLDGRGPYPAEFFRRVGPHDPGTFAQLGAEHGLNTALVSSAEYGPSFPADAWAVVFWDSAYLVLLRRSPANLPLLERLEYREFLPGRPLPQDRTRLLRALDETRRNQAERAHPDWSVAISTGIALLQLRDLPAAEREMRRATELGPREPEPWAFLSTALSRLGRRSEAAVAAARARALDPAQKRIGGILAPARP